MTKSPDERELLRGFSLAVIEFLRLDWSGASLEPLRTTNSLRGLRDAARDVVEMCQDVAVERIEAIDAHLTSDGLPTHAV